MELIKKYHKKIIISILFITSILLMAITFIIRPQRSSSKEIYNYNTTPKLIDISFPYSLKIPLSTKADYIEIHFGDDSINAYDYNITALKNSELIFTHDYKNETSNIVRIPLKEADFNNNDSVDIKISCLEKCENVNFELYETDDNFIPKVIIATPKLDLYYLWFAWLIFVIGLTLAPLTYGDNK